MITLTLPGLVTLNEYIDAERSNRYKAATIKRTQTELVAMCVLGQHRKELQTPLAIHCYWQEDTRRKDPDNVAFAKKFILDGMVAAGLIENDGWKQIVEFRDKFVLGESRGVVLEIIENALEVRSGG